MKSRKVNAVFFFLKRREREAILTREAKVKDFYECVMWPGRCGANALAVFYSSFLPLTRLQVRVVPSSKESFLKDKENYFEKESKQTFPPNSYLAV
jgi:hypothetical protein